jgi:hypothetical protein
VLLMAATGVAAMMPALMVVVFPLAVVVMAPAACEFSSVLPPAYDFN